MKQKQEIRKGFEWFRTLTKKQQKRFRIECHRHRGLKKFQYAMNDTNSFFGFIMTSFIFSETEKGFDYWWNMSKR